MQAAEMEREQHHLLVSEGNMILNLILMCGCAWDTVGVWSKGLQLGKRAARRADVPLSDEARKLPAANERLH